MDQQTRVLCREFECFLDEMENKQDFILKAKMRMVEEMKKNNAHAVDLLVSSTMEDIIRNCFITKKMTGSCAGYLEGILENLAELFEGGGVMAYADHWRERGREEAGCQL